MNSEHFPHASHDHAQCRKELLQRAETSCARSGARLTKLRRTVLHAVGQSHQAVGAYEVIERIAETGSRPAPISVYRALDFLMEQGLVHKIESRNAFVACCRQAHRCDAVLMICEDCGVVAELDADEEISRLTDKAVACGFQPSQTITELTGTCSVCAGNA
jgi:Fur family zinc uptake transcriptional regulator